MSKQLVALGVEGTPEEVHNKYFKSRLDQLTLTITSLIESLAGEGSRQDMEYEKE